MVFSRLLFSDGGLPAMVGLAKAELASQLPPCVWKLIREQKRARNCAIPNPFAYVLVLSVLLDTEPALSRCERDGPHLGWRRV